MANFSENFPSTFPQFGVFKENSMSAVFVVFFFFSQTEFQYQKNIRYLLS